MGQTTTGDPFWDLVATARHLHSPRGCPWDRAQTIESLLPYLVEETWEVFEGVRGRRWVSLREELGDVLYTVLFLSLLAERRRLWTLRSLLRTTQRKMVRRHPHVFGLSTARTPREAYDRWTAAKRKEQRQPSRSKRLRPLLVALWDRLHADPAQQAALERWLVSGSPKRSRAKSSPRTTRSSRPA